MSLRDTWEADQVALGITIGLGDPASAELLSRAGYDYFCIDLQHGLVELSHLVPVLRSTANGVVPLVRTATASPSEIGRVLDLGAAGVIVPDVRTVEQARSVARCFSYPPDGVRSYGPIRALPRGPATPREELEAAPLCVVMIESREGLENVGEVAKVERLDALYVGPADLSLALGMKPSLDVTRPEIAGALREVVEACEGQGVVAGIQCGDVAGAAACIELGFKLVTVGFDFGLLASAGRRQLKALREQLDAP